MSYVSNAGVIDVAEIKAALRQNGLDATDYEVREMLRV